MNIPVSLKKILYTLSFSLILFLVSSVGAHAADVCCGCNPQGASATPKQGCFILTDTQLTNPSDCTTIKDASILNGMVCDKTVLQTTQCAIVAKNGLCQNEPAKTGGVVSGISDKINNTLATPPAPELTMTFNTPIPGFTAPKDMGMLFATYIVAIFRYMISIAVFLTTVMFIWGAFRYLVGSSMGSVSRGKEIMKDAVIGLLLVLSANLILRTINPDLVTLKSLSLSEIESRLWQPVDTAFNVPLGSRSQLKSAVIQQAKATGIPEIPCMAKATIDRESGGNLGAINHNEDFNSNDYSVKSRQLYLTQGGYGKFTPIPCSDASCQRQSGVPRNGDVLNVSAPPNYGLDLRYSHALGAAQAAIFPKDQPCPGKEGMGPGHRETARGKSICLTIPELMSADGAAAVIVMQSIRNLQRFPSNIAQALGAYVGNLTADHPESRARFAIFTACMGRGIDSYPDYNGSSAGLGSKGGGGLDLATGMKVLLIGDSLAHGMSSTFQTLFQNAGATYSAVYKDGMAISAFSNGQMSGALTTELAKRPNYVLISLGTNDEYVSPGNIKSTANVGNAKIAYKALMDKITASGATPIWILPPTLPDKYDGGGTVRANGDQIEDILKTTSAYFDSKTVELKRPANEIHPSGAGYKTWATAVYNWMTKK